MKIELAEITRILHIERRGGTRRRNRADLENAISMNDSTRLRRNYVEAAGGSTFDPRLISSALLSLSIPLLPERDGRLSSLGLYNLDVNSQRRGGAAPDGRNVPGIATFSSASAGKRRRDVREFKASVILSARNANHRVFLPHSCTREGWTPGKRNRAGRINFQGSNHVAAQTRLRMGELPSVGLPLGNFSLRHTRLTQQFCTNRILHG